MKTQAETDTQKDRAFSVRIASTGEVIEVAEDETIVEALANHGLDIPVSCTHGLCGTCLTRVLEGEPEHRDFYLTQDEREENRQMLPCCSRSKSDMLVLDL